MAELKKGARITGGDRSKLAADLKKKYTQEARASGSSPARRAGPTASCTGSWLSPGCRCAVAAAPRAARSPDPAHRQRRCWPTSSARRRRASRRSRWTGRRSATRRPRPCGGRSRPIGRELLADDSVRVVVLRGEGESFSAGLDRAMFDDRRRRRARPRAARRDSTTTPLDATIAGFQEAFTWWRDPRVVSIAAVQGHAVGAGFQLALGLRPARGRRRRAARDAGAEPRPRPRPRRDQAAGRARRLRARPGDLRDRPVGRRRGGGRHRARHRSPYVARSWTGRPLDLAAALLTRTGGAVRATKELLQGAAGRSHDEQQAAERAAQAGGCGTSRGLRHDPEWT